MRADSGIGSEVERSGGHRSSPGLVNRFKNLSSHAETSLGCHLGGLRKWALTRSNFPMRMRT
jgi:hypothetical protein